MVLLFTCLPAIILAQNKQTGFFENLSVGTQGYYGTFLISKAKAEYIRDSYTYLAEVYVEKQTDGRHPWERTHRLPQWGFSYIYGNTGSKKYMGRLNAVSAYITTPLLTRKNYRGSFRLGFGPGWVSKPFNIYSNPKNTLIGTHLNAYILMMLQNEIRITPRLFANAGLSFIHVSNGGVTLPNLGLNSPGLSLGFRYAFKKQNYASVAVDKDSVDKKLTWKLFFTAGAKQAPWIGSRHYLINTLQAEAVKKVAPNHGWGAGVVAYYNRSLEFNPLETPGSPRNKKKLQLGVYGEYEHFFGRLSIPLQAGVYVYNRDRFPLLFQQFGIRIQANKHFGATVMLKIHSGQADFIHGGISYTF